MANSGFKGMAVVSPSMVRGIFNELCRNGYNERQIEALSAELAEMATMRREHREAQSLWRLANQNAAGEHADNSEDGLFAIGCPEGFESLCRMLDQPVRAVTAVS